MKLFKGIICENVFRFVDCPLLKLLPNGLCANKISIASPLQDEQNALIVFNKLFLRLDDTAQANRLHQQFTKQLAAYKQDDIGNNFNKKMLFPMDTI